MHLVRTLTCIATYVTIHAHYLHTHTHTLHIIHSFYTHVYMHTLIHTCTATSIPHNGAADVGSSQHDCA